jgi:hypothetical protein
MLDEIKFLQDLMDHKYPTLNSLFDFLYTKDGNGKQIFKHPNISCKLVGPRMDDETNAGSIEKQGDPFHALIEEDVANIWDEVLLKEWEKRGSKSEEMSWSRKKAIKEFFGLDENNIDFNQYSDKQRQQLADKIGYVKIWNEQNPEQKSYKGVVVDRRDYGRGVVGSKFTSTFVGLERGQKSRFSFTIGKYGWGGSSRNDKKLFKGMDGYTLYVSRSESEPDKIYFTLVFFKFSEYHSRKPQYYYLLFDEKIPSVSIEDYDFGECGSLIRTFNADISGSVVKASIAHDNVKNKLSHAFANNILPIRVLDIIALTASDKNKKKYERTYKKGRVVNGNIIRINDKKLGKSNTTPIEWDSEVTLDYDYRDPDDLEISKMSPVWEEEKNKVGKITVRLILFPMGDNARETQFCDKDECGSITLDGQTHAPLSKNVIEKTGLSFLSSFLLIYVDVDDTLPSQKESMFASTREASTKTSEATKPIREILIDYLSTLEILKQYNKRYKDTVVQAKEISEKDIDKLYRIFGVGSKNLKDDGDSSGTGNGNSHGNINPDHDILLPSEDPNILEFVNRYEDNPKSINREGYASARVRTDIPPVFQDRLVGWIEDEYGNWIADCKLSKINKGRLTATIHGKKLT